MAANQSARVVLARRGEELRATVARACRGGPRPPGLELTRIAERGCGAHWLVVLRGADPEARVEVAVAAAAARWQLTRRQREVLAHLARGAATATIAAHLQVSTRAVELHVTALLERAQVENRAALVARVLSEG